jgi:hypothetical protein
VLRFLFSQVVRTPVAKHIEGSPAAGTVATPASARVDSPNPLWSLGELSERKRNPRLSVLTDESRPEEGAPVQKTECPASGSHRYTFIGIAIVCNTSA